MLLLALATAAPALARLPTPVNTSPSNVLDIYQSTYITAQGTFTVHAKVADSSQINRMYFSFCQLTSGVCYTPPVTMTEQGTTNVWAGTTSPMTAYTGMKVGVKAGYNLTVQYSNSGNLLNLTYPYQPTLSNPFTNLTAVQTAPPSNEWMFAMEVENQVYNVAGTITDGSTGQALGGATVTLAGTNATPVTTGATGTYSFEQIPNGTYSMSVAAAGFRTSTVSVNVRGGNAVENVAMYNGSTPQPSSSSGGLGFLETPLGVAIIAAAIAILAGIGVGIARARRKTGDGGGGSGAVGTPETTNAPPKSG